MSVKTRRAIRMVSTPHFQSEGGELRAKFKTQKWLLLLVIEIEKWLCVIF